MSIPNKDQIEEYLKSLEEFLSSSISSLSDDILGLPETAQRLWHVLSRFGPPQLPVLSDLHIPGLESIQVPPPPPPAPLPPPPQSWITRSGDWIIRHKRFVGVIGIASIGAGLLAAYNLATLTKSSRHLIVKSSTTKVRNRVVVVLGGDSPLAAPLISSLESSGFIVIATVSGADAVVDLENRYNGYVRALVMDPKEPASMSYFLRSLQATLSLRFPINVAGDPYHHLTSATQPYIHSLISLLTLPSPTTTPIPTPFEHLSLTSTYISYLTQTHVTPLQAIQALLPFFRTSNAQARDYFSCHGIGRSIIICVPATDARVGVPFASAQAMSAAATVRGAEVLRREIRAVSKSEDRSMENLKVVVVDVGAVGFPGTPPEHNSAEAIENSMIQWTPSERAVYGSAFSHVLQQMLGELPRRTPQRPNTFVTTLLDLIGESEINGRQKTFYRALSRIKNRTWSLFRRERLSVGAGARTYTLASFLPNSVLDTLLQLPPFLIALQNAYLPSSSRPTRNELESASTTLQKSTTNYADDLGSSQASLSDTDQHMSDSNASLDADASDQSNVDNASAVESSWINLQK